jgi:hypothetical protein
LSISGRCDSGNGRGTRGAPAPAPVSVRRRTTSGTRSAIDATDRARTRRRSTAAGPARAPHPTRPSQVTRDSGKRKLSERPDNPADRDPLLADRCTPRGLLHCRQGVPGMLAGSRFGHAERPGHVCLATPGNRASSPPERRRSSRPSSRRSTRPTRPSPAIWHAGSDRRPGLRCGRPSATARY